MMQFSEIDTLIYISILLSAALWYYWKEPRFYRPIGATLSLLVYSGFYTSAMYLVARIGLPLMDAELAWLDESIGIHLPSIVKWTKEHHRIDVALQMAYASVGVQTTLVVILSKNPWLFLRRFMLGSSICLVAFALWPAAGPFAYYGYQMHSTQANYLAHFEGCREGTMALMCKSAEGLITFPSFHVIWAMLLMAASKFWWPSILLNTAVIIGTMTTGWHYGVDVIAGLMIGTWIILKK